jgi:hemerythrin superfamily protein
MAEPTEIGGKIVGKAREAIAKVQGYPGIFSRLIEEHLEVKMMMMRLNASDNIKLRGELFPVIRAELLSHAHGEEQEVYPVLESFPELRDLIRAARNDHHLVESDLDALSELELDAPGWKPLFEKIMTAVLSHAQEEEDDIFPKAKDLIDKDTADKLKERFLSVKERELALLRPH